MYSQPYISQPNYRNTVNYYDGDNANIIEVIHANFPTAVRQTKQLAAHLKGSDHYENAKNIYEFIKENVRYEKDPDGEQLIRLPSRLLADGEGDCKSYSLLSAALLHNMDMPVKFRYASYNGKKIPSHVYTVTEDEEGKEIILDAVYKSFNKEEPYKFKTDKTMKIQTLSGVTYDNPVNGTLVGDWLRGAVGRAKKTVNNVVEFVQTNGKKVAASPVRNAFLLLVKLNVRNLASNLYKALLNGKESEMRKTWENWGGTWSSLKTQIYIGKAKKSIGNIAEDKLAQDFEDFISSYNGGGIGLTGAEAAAAVALATPLLIALSKFFKTVEGDLPEEEKVDQDGNNTFDGLYELIDVGNEVYKSEFGDKPAVFAKEIIKAPAEPKTEFKISTPMVITGIVVIGGIIYFTRNN